MFAVLRRWREQRVLRRAAIPDALWRQSLEVLPFLSRYDAAEQTRLRSKVVFFLHAKTIIGAGGHTVTPLQRVIIAAQACVLVLNLDATLYDGWESVIVYPSAFVPAWEWQDEAGVMHRNSDALMGEAMPGGPVVLSWPDVSASADWGVAGMNLVVHEFAHKLDMGNGAADGFPPLPASMPHAAWQAALADAYDDFSARVARGEDTAIDPYAAEHPAEFFAVLSEVFFAEPQLLLIQYPAVYRQFAQFYRQDPAHTS